MHRRIDVQTVCMSIMYAHTVAGASISMYAYSHATIRHVLSFHLSTGMWYASCYSKKRTMQTRRYACAGPLWGVFVAANANTLACRPAPNLATYPQKNPQTYPQRMVWFLLRGPVRILCVLALHCYKLLQKEVNKCLLYVCYALYYTHTNNAPKETHHANHPALRSSGTGSSGNHHHGGGINFQG